MLEPLRIHLTAPPVKSRWRFWVRFGFLAAALLLAWPLPVWRYCLFCLCFIWYTALGRR